MTNLETDFKKTAYLGVFWALSAEEINKGDNLLKW